MQRFINIKTNQLWQFKDWDEIVKLGGLWKILPINERDFIFNENAVMESFGLYFPNWPPENIFKAYELFVFDK